MSDSQETGSVNWMDLTVPDAERVRDFYQQVVGWTPKPVAMGGYDDFAMSAGGSGKSVAGVCHARGSNEGIPPVWLVYITVDELEKSVEACTGLGGRVLKGPVNIGPNSKYAIIQDPAGAVCALYEDSSRTKPV